MAGLVLFQVKVEMPVKLEGEYGDYGWAMFTFRVYSSNHLQSKVEKYWIVFLRSDLKKILSSFQITVIGRMSADYRLQNWASLQQTNTFIDL